MPRPRYDLAYAHATTHQKLIDLKTPLSTSRSARLDLSLLACNLQVFYCGYYGLSHTDLLIFTSSFPLLIGSPFKSISRMNRYPCWRRSSRMQAQANSLSCLTFDSSCTLNL
jgi:hypothetical protein